MSPRILIHHYGISPKLIAALEAKGVQVDLAESTTETVQGLEITSVYFDELPPQPLISYRPTHKGKVIAQWKSESRGRRS